MSGLWDQKGIPHKGWTCFDVDDLEDGRQIRIIADAVENREKPQSRKAKPHA